MPNNVLYFPYINLPKSEWTYRTLFYYDGVLSIVPADYFYEPERNFEGFMLELVRRNLVIPINPMELLKHPFELTRPFLEFVQSDSFQMGKRRKIFRRGRTSMINNQKFEPRSKVSSLKFDQELLYSLEQMGIAKKGAGNWYEVEQKTAGYLMAYLASILANRMEVLPVTDSLRKLDPLKQFSGFTRKVNDRRSRILQEFIPYPMDINLDKLQRFKEKNFESLGLFRTVIEQIALDPTYENENLLNEKIKELLYHQKQITTKMAKSKLGDILFGTVFGIFGAFQGLSQNDSTSGILYGLPGFVSAIHAALKIEKPESIHDQTGMKYIALLQRRVSVDRTHVKGKWNY